MYVHDINMKQEINYKYVSEFAWSLSNVLQEHTCMGQFKTPMGAAASRGHTRHACSLPAKCTHYVHAPLGNISDGHQALQAYSKQRPTPDGGNA